MQNILKKIALIFVFCAVTGGFAALAYMLYQHQNPEANLAALLIDDDKKIIQAFFSPDDHVRDILIGLINAEKKSLSIAIYTLTDKNIAGAIKEAYNRGVHVEIVADSGYGNDRYSKIAQLANTGIGIWAYQSGDEERASSLMHDKFIIFEDNIQHHALVFTGSLNFTVRANERNQENVVILDHPRIVDRFKKQFAILKKRSLRINAAD